MFIQHTKTIIIIIRQGYYKNIGPWRYHPYLIWFGKAGYDGMSLITIPEVKLAIVPGFILHPQHLTTMPGKCCRLLMGNSP